MLGTRTWKLRLFQKDLTAHFASQKKEKKEKRTIFPRKSDVQKGGEGNDYINPAFSLFLFLSPSFSQPRSGHRHTPYGLFSYLRFFFPTSAALNRTRKNDPQARGDKSVEGRASRTRRSSSCPFLPSVPRFHRRFCYVRVSMCVWGAP